MKGLSYCKQNALRVDKSTTFAVQCKSSSIKSYPVMESFLSIQGEGGHQGKTAHFIRLAGCDVGCPWCDVPSLGRSQIMRRGQFLTSLRKLKRALLRS